MENIIPTEVKIETRGQKRIYTIEESKKRQLANSRKCMKNKFDRDRIQECLEKGIIQSADEGVILFKKGRVKFRPEGYKYHYEYIKKPKKDKVIISDEDKKIRQAEYTRRFKEKKKRMADDEDNISIAYDEDSEKSVLLTKELGVATIIWNFDKIWRAHLRRLESDLRACATTEFR